MNAVACCEVPELPCEVLAIIISYCPSKFVGIDSFTTGEALRVIWAVLDNLPMYRIPDGFDQLTQLRLKVDGHAVEALHGSRRVRAEILGLGRPAAVGPRWPGAYVARWTHTEHSYDYVRGSHYASQSSDILEQSKLAADLIGTGEYIQHSIYEVTFAQKYCAVSQYDLRDGMLRLVHATVYSECCYINIWAGTVEVIFGQCTLLVDSEGLRYWKSEEEIRPDWAGAAEVLTSATLRIAVKPKVVARVQQALKWMDERARV